MTDRTTFRPDAVTVDDRALRRFRSHAELLGVNRRRLYGLALEFAVDRDEEFRTFAREASDESR